MGIDEFKAELSALLPLADVVGRWTPLRCEGRSAKGMCPWCPPDGTGDLHVYDDHFHCFSCGAHGDHIVFVMQTTGVDAATAILDCASEAGIDLSPSVALRLGAELSPGEPAEAAELCVESLSRFPGDETRVAAAGAEPSSPGLGGRAMRDRLSRPGFAAFVDTMAFLGLDARHGQKLLGDMPAEEYYRHVREGATSLSFDVLSRMSAVFGIVKALRTLFVDDETSRRFLRAKNKDAPFSGESPLHLMMEGSLERLFQVRDYLWAWVHSPWP